VTHPADAPVLMYQGEAVTGTIGMPVDADHAVGL
jgi:hypothetical protein